MTQLLWQIVFSNAVTAVALALLAGAIGLLVKKPAVMRAAWIIVLLKLLTPPVWTVPVQWPAERPHQQLAPVQTITAPNLPAMVDLSSELPSAAEIHVELAPIDAPPLPAPHVPVWRAAITWLAPIWITGSILLLMLTLIRLLGLRRLLRRSVFAPESVQELAARVAARMGIRHSPGVWLVPGPVCPALWAFTRTPKILIPFGLWSGLDDRQRQTLLAHELAHLRRRDHWVRLLEAVCALLWWWHPAVWWARRRIHDFEEQCCDAWVLWAVPSSARSYGDALLATVEFVSMYRPVRPALSAGMGEFHHLKRRLLMIRQGQVGRALSRTGLLSVCGAGMLALSLGPVLAQSATPVPAATPPEAVDAPQAPQPPMAMEMDRGQADVAVAEASVAQARARIDQLRAELAEAQASLKMAQARLKVLEEGGALPPGHPPIPTRPGALPGVNPFGAAAGLSPLPPAGTVSPPQPGMVPPAGMPGRMGGLGAGQPPAAGIGGGFGGGGFGRGLAGGGFGTVGSPTTTPPAAGSRTRATTEDQERRLDAMERQLTMIMRELRDIKRQNASQHQSGTRGEPAPTQAPEGRP